MNDNLQPKFPKPVVLAILDGWGIAAPSVSNAISQAKTPNFDKLTANYFCTTLQASGLSVGLPYGEMGNSEVGHLNLGAGKIVYQNLPRINRAILDGEFFDNVIFLKALAQVKKQKSKLHLLGLISTGGVHASLDHLYALLELAKKQKIEKVFVHCILDGRDMAYNSGQGLLQELKNKMKEIGVGEIASVVGRFYAMDRDNHFERTEIAYRLLTDGSAEKRTKDVLQSVQEFYDTKIYDEEMKPIVVVNENDEPIGKVENKDAVIFFNFRPDRARQLTKAFVLPGWEKFTRIYLPDLYFVTLTQYEKQLPSEVAYPPETVKETLAQVLSEQGLKQLRLAETEKYAHVTYFFNGGKEEKLVGEEREMIPSLRVESYAEKPEMSALTIKERALKEINAKNFDLITLNFANLDMVGHTGDMKATIKATEIVDKCLGELAAATLAAGGILIVTADHGNAEELINTKTGEIDKEHSCSPVPFVLVGENYKTHSEGGVINLSLLTPAGVLADVAPTILKIMGLEQPKEMTGRSLV
ncbi:MAG: 2,3-bisphosphoglycerate-independent phosphoglycerate mutase [Patescibacteria group bacterium]|nr:2,3-bisphosphoglycerate-independent phosphoglycerate mutase [Patescibacteria group bacterium]